MIAVSNLKPRYCQIRFCSDAYHHPGNTAPLFLIGIGFNKYTKLGFMTYLARTGFALILFYNINGCAAHNKQPETRGTEPYSSIPKTDTVIVQLPDTVLYNEKMQQLANGDRSGRWPPKTVYPKEGALLPFNRIVAYYGNFYSAQMGVLGEYPVDEMIKKLESEKLHWENADTLTPVIPAIHYIAVTAQHSAGADSKYRLRMPFDQIDKAVGLAAKVNGILFLDVQVGLSTLENEIPLLRKYLLMPRVHLGIDPEYSMKSGKRPGTSVGTFDAADINYACEYLAAIVKDNDLPPKILVVHRFRTDMLTNYKKIKTCNEVQLVINMDGFGSPQLKKQTYYYAIYREPVQFTGFKLFYKTDVKSGKHLMSPGEILNLKPQPIYIQYQ